MKHTFISYSDRGKVRKQNEDFAGHGLNDAINAEIFCIADGMGGYGKGDIASRTVVNSVLDNFLAIKDIGPNSYDKILIDLFPKAQEALLNVKENKNMQSMLGTTLAVLAIIRDKVVYANIGDTRIYCFDGRNLVQKSYDHTFVNDLLKNKSISKDEAVKHPKKHVLTQAITGEEKQVKPYVSQESVNNDNIYLLCSDGLYNMMEEDFICTVLKQSSIFDAKETFLKQAFANGAKDNISFQIIRPFDGEKN